LAGYGVMDRVALSQDTLLDRLELCEGDGGGS
jgi:hypothetical protein